MSFVMSQKSCLVSVSLIFYHSFPLTLLFFQVDLTHVIDTKLTILINYSNVNFLTFNENDFADGQLDGTPAPETRRRRIRRYKKMDVAVSFKQCLCTCVFS